MWEDLSVVISDFHIMEKNKAEKLLIVVTAMALVILFLAQVEELDNGKYIVLATETKTLGFRGNLIIQTIFTAISILIVGGTLIYLNRKRK